MYGLINITHWFNVEKGHLKKINSLPLKPPCVSFALKIGVSLQDQCGRNKYRMWKNKWFSEAFVRISGCLSFAFDSSLPPTPQPFLLRHDKIYQLTAAKRSKQFLLCKKEYLCSNSVF